MPLPRYNPSEVRAVTGASAIPAQAEAQTWQTLSNKLDQWSGTLFQQGVTQREKEAKKDAESAFMNEGTNAKITEDYTIYGQSYNTSLRALQAKQISIDTNNSLQKYFESSPDNAQSFINQAEAYYKGALKEMPEDLKAEYAIDFEAKKSSYLAKVRANEKIKNDDIKLSVGNDFYKQQYNLATQASRDGSYKLAITEAQKAEENLTDLRDSGLITYVQYEKQVDVLYKSVADAKYQGENDRLIEDNNLEGSQKYIDKFRKTTNKLYSDEEREKLADEMQAALNAKIRQNKLNNDANKAEADILVTDAIKIYNSGKKPNNIEDIIMSSTLVTPKKRHDLKVAEKAYSIIRKVDYLTLPEQQAYINAMEAKPNANIEEVDALAQAKKNISEKLRMAEKDPYSLGVQDGIYEQAGVLIPSQGLGALVQNLPTRVKQSLIEESAYGTPRKLFTDAEVQQYSAWLNSPTTSINEKLDFIETLENTIPGNSSIVYKQLNEKGASIFSFAGSMIKKGDRQKAEMMLRGQVILREQPGVVPFDDMQWKLNGSIGNALRYQGEGVRKSLSEATTAYYAALAEQEGKLSKENAPLDLVKRAVKDTTGGVAQRNDQSYFLPPGVESGNDVDDWIETLTKDDFKDVIGVTPEQAVEVVNNGQLISVGEGKYNIIYQGRVLKSSNGKPFILEYKK